MIPRLPAHNLVTIMTQLIHLPVPRTPERSRKDLCWKRALQTCSGGCFVSCVVAWIADAVSIYGVELRVCSDRASISVYKWKVFIHLHWKDLSYMSRPIFISIFPTILILIVLNFVIIYLRKTCINWKHTAGTVSVHPFACFNTRTAQWILTKFCIRGP